MTKTSTAVIIVILALVVATSILAVFYFTMSKAPAGCSSDAVCKQQYGSDYVCRGQSSGNAGFCVKSTLCNGGIPVINWLGCLLGV